jgi:hypothetical protein
MDREDAEALPWMTQYTRDTIPKKVVWKQASTTHDRFYWLAVPAGTAKANNEVIASYSGQDITIQSKDVAQVTIRLNDRMLDLDKPIAVHWGADQVFQGHISRTIATLARALAERGDPKDLFAAELEIHSPAAPQK